MRSDEQSKAPARTWLQGEQRAGNRAARPVVALGLLAIAMAVGQAWCAASLLASALTNHRDSPLPLLAGFGALALLRAGIAAVNDRTAFNLAPCHGGDSGRTRFLVCFMPGRRCYVCSTLGNSQPQ